MIIRGKDRKFLLAVRGRDEISKLCPDGDISKIDELLKNAKTTEFLRNVCLIMNRDYEDNRHYYDSSYEVDYITSLDLEMLTMEQFREIGDEAADAFLKGMGIDIEAEEPKTKGKKTGNAKVQ